MSLNELRSNMRNPSHRFQIHFPLIAGHWSTQRCTIAIVKTICWEIGKNTPWHLKQHRYGTSMKILHFSPGHICTSNSSILFRTEEYQNFFHFFHYRYFFVLEPFSLPNQMFYLAGGTVGYPAQPELTWRSRRLDTQPNPY